MDADTFTEALKELLYSEAATEAGLEPARLDSFAGAGLLTNDEGLVISLADGSKFQLTIVQA